jgi:hypothetical protein
MISITFQRLERNAIKFLEYWEYGLLAMKVTAKFRTDDRGSDLLDHIVIELGSVFSK